MEYTGLLVNNYPTFQIVRKTRGKGKTTKWTVADGASGDNFIYTEADLYPVKYQVFDPGKSHHPNVIEEYAHTRNVDEL